MTDVIAFDFEHPTDGWFVVEVWSYEPPASGHFAMHSPDGEVDAQFGAFWIDVDGNLFEDMQDSLSPSDYQDFVSAYHAEGVRREQTA